MDQIRASRIRQCLAAERTREANTSTPNSAQHSGTHAGFIPPAGDAALAVGPAIASTTICTYRNTSSRTTRRTKPLPAWHRYRLSVRRRTFIANVMDFSVRHSWNAVRMGTLTASRLSDDEFRRAYDRFRNGYLTKNYSEAIVVFERQKNGALHAHVPTSPHVRLRSPRHEHADWTAAARACGLGDQCRLELPRKEPLAVARYLSKDMLDGAEPYLRRVRYLGDKRVNAKVAGKARLQRLVLGVFSPAYSPRAVRWRKYAPVHARELYEAGVVHAPTSTEVGAYYRGKYGDAWYNTLTNAVMDVAVKHGEVDDRPMTCDEYASIKAHLVNRRREYAHPHSVR